MKLPVLIVGAGPVGLALAGDLGWRGIGCLLIEKGDGAIFQPKMDFVGVRTMEFCRRWGIVGRVEEAGYNRDYPQDCAWVTSLNGYELGRERFPSPREERPPAQSPQKRERCPQDFFDPVLVRFARGFPHVTLRYDTQLTGFEERADGVSATVVDQTTGRQETIEADYVVGCDGGASTVRQRLEIGMSGSPVLTYTTNVVFRCEGLEKLHDKAPGYRFIFIGPEGTWSTLVAINGRDRWRFSLVGDETPRAYAEDEVRKAIIRAVGRDFDFEILSVMPWMNTGIQDSVDLGWKLEACLGGWGGTELLASYETERRPVGIRNVTEATGNLKRMLTPRAQHPAAEIFRPGPEGDRARVEFGRNFTQMMRREWFTLGIHLGYSYEGSPIIVPDGTSAMPDEVSTYTQTSRPGARAPHVWLSEGKSTLDLYGRGFVLLRLGARPPDADRIIEAARRRGVPLSVVDIDHEETNRIYARRMVLVRPDGHSAWRGDRQPEDALGLVDTVRGAGAE